MPGTGDIGGGSAKIEFHVTDSQGNKKTSWHAHDPDVNTNTGKITIELLVPFTQAGSVITVPLQPMNCVKIDWK